MKSSFKVGDKISVKPGKEHDPKMKNASGTVSVVSSPALGLSLSGMKGVHKWYVASELKRLSKKATGSRLGM